MKRRPLELAIALLFLAMAVGVVFFAPPEELSRNGGVRGGRSGDIFLGWVTLFGEPIARAILGTLFFGVAWHFFRRSRL